jgi:tetratricopeptide (TPR) repeat protein
MSMPSAKDIRVRYLDWPGFACCSILAAGAIVAYHQTFSVPLILDDHGSINDNSSIHQLLPIWQALSPPNDAPVGGRPLLNLSFAINYAFGGTSVFGYHLVNLLIHIVASWTLFALVRHTLRRPAMTERFGSLATPLALAVGAIWAWHPVQTESVTYISQRAESLMGLFYLMTLYCFALGAETDGRRLRGIWYSLAVLCCLAGVATKEVIVTAPLMVVLYDRTFISGAFRDGWRRHWPLYVALAATWLPLCYRAVNLRHIGVGFGLGTAWWDYGLTECRAIVKYLLLAIWPNPLVFDYGMFIRPRLSEVWPYALVLLALLAATVVALRRKPAAGFAACWFLLILVPTSSIVPVVGQPMAENRLYLSLAGVVAFAVAGAFALIGRWSLPVFAVVAVSLGLGTIRRNKDFLSEQAIWTDTVAKCPDNARAHNNLGLVWDKTPGRQNEAIAQYKEALRLDPDYAEAHNNLGCILEKMPGRLDEAVVQYEEALRLKPDYAETHYNLGNAMGSLGRTEEAIAQYKEALRLKPGYPEAHYNLGNALNSLGRTEESIGQYGEALRLWPDYAEAHNNLGLILSKVPGRLDDAVVQFEEALRLKPDIAEAHTNLGNALSKTPGRVDDAVAQYEEALRLKPDYADAHFYLANTLAQTGRIPDAIEHYEAALRCQPDLVEASNNLGMIFCRVGRLQEGMERIEAAIRMKPDFAQAHFARGAALMQAGRRDEAIAEYERVLQLRPGDPSALRMLELIRAQR